MSKKKNVNRGSTLDELLEAEGVLEKFQGIAIKEVIAFQIAREMELNEITKDAMAKRMKTSRAQLNRLLDPTNEGVTLQTLQRAASVLGKQIRLELV